jgi:hypothetical protein
MEQFKLSFREPEYVINEENKEVKCTMQYTLKGNPKMLGLLKCMGNLWFGNEYNNPFIIGFESSYTAHACDGDVFDVNIGKKIARTNAESNAYVQSSNLIFNMINKYSGILEYLHEGFYVKAQSVIDHNAEYLLPYYGEQ